MDISSGGAHNEVIHTDNGNGTTVGRGAGSPAPKRRLTTRGRRLRRASSSLAVAVLAAGGLTAGTVVVGAGAASAATAKLSKVLPASVKTGGSVSLGTDANWPVCEYYPKGSGTIAGYEVDLWNAAAKLLGITVKPTSIQFTSLIPAVQSGRFSTAAACFADNATREKQLIFVDFSLAGTRIYTTSANPGHISADPLSLCGKTTATQTGTATVQWVTTTATPYCTKKGKAAITNLEFPSINSALLALYNGKADFFLDTTAAGAYLQKHAPKKIISFSTTLEATVYDGMIFPKSNKQLATAFLAAYKAIEKSGQYAKIFKKWGLTSLVLKNPGLTLATTRPLPGATTS